MPEVLTDRKQLPLELRQFRLSVFAVRDAMGIADTREVLSRIAPSAGYAERTVFDLFSNAPRAVDPQLIRSLGELVESLRMRMGTLVFPDRLSDLDLYALGNVLPSTALDRFNEHENLYTEQGMKCDTDAQIQLLQGLTQLGYTVSDIRRYLGSRISERISSGAERSSMNDAYYVPAQKMKRMLRFCRLIETGEYPSDMPSSRVPLNQEDTDQLRAWCDALMQHNGIKNMRQLSSELGFNPNSIEYVFSSRALDVNGVRWIQRDYFDLIKEAYQSIDPIEIKSKGLKMDCDQAAIATLIDELLSRGYSLTQLRPHLGRSVEKDIFPKVRHRNYKGGEFINLSADKVQALLRLCTVVATGDYPEDFTPSKIQITVDRAEELKHMIRSLAPSERSLKAAIRAVSKQFGFAGSMLITVVFSPKPDQRGRIWLRREHWNTIKQAYEALPKSD